MPVIALFILLFLLFSGTGTNADSKDPLFFYKRAEKFTKNGKLDEAFIDYLQFIKEQPYEFEVRDALYQIGNIKFQQKKFPDSITYFERLLKNYKTYKFNSEARITLARSYFGMGVFQKSREIFAEFIKNNRKDSELLFYARHFLGKIYLKEKKKPQALTEFLYAASYLKSIKMPDRGIVDETFFLVSKLCVEKKNIPDAYTNFLKLSPEFIRENQQIETLKRKIMNSYLTESSGLPELTVTTVKFDSDDVWIGTWISGIVRYTRSSNKFSYFTLEDGLLSNEVRDILIDTDFVWISTIEGISRFSKKDSTFKTYLRTKDDDTFKTQRIYQDDRFIFFGTLGAGVKKYDKVSGELKLYGKTSPIGSVMVPSVRGDENLVVFSTLGNGVIVYDKREEKYKRYNVESGLAGNDVRDAIPDGRFIWVAIHGKGINKIDLITGNIEFLGEDKNLNLTYPVYLAKRGSEIWVGTLDAGLRIYRRETGDWEKYTVLNGLSSNDINHIEFEGDYIWIGTLDKGISVIYYPEKNKF